MLRILFAFFALLACAASASRAAVRNLNDVLKQPAAWFQSEEGRGVITNVLAYQYPSGGWPKNLDMIAPMDAAAREKFTQARVEATIDNGATHTQLRVLALAFSATGDATQRAAFERGVDYLLAAQYANGGWPMIFPLRKGYYSHITYNDNAGASVLRLVDDIARGQGPFAFVDAERRARATDAVRRGIDCLLRTQVVRNGERTAWCAQHDETTFAPAPARKFEPVSLSGHESVGLVDFLMSVEQPSPEIIAAVDAAVRWLSRVSITGVRVETIDTPEGKDRRVVPDPAAPPIWARFYELETDRPIFIGRDAEIRYSLAEIEQERRIGYAYYGNWPARILGKRYADWSARVRPAAAAVAPQEATPAAAARPDAAPAVDVAGL